VIENEQPMCTMYGVCTKTPDGKRTLNCYANHPPKKIDPIAYANLTAFCPEMLEMYGTDELCCKEDQIADLVSQLQTPKGIISRCPSCWYNFRQSFCEFTCSPYQAHFLKVAKFYPPVNETSPKVVESVDFYVTKRHAQGSFDSCKNVVMGATNSFALDVLCGGWGALRCNPQRWYGYMGSTSNGYAPFDIYYRFQDPEYGNITAAPDGYYKEVTEYDIYDDSSTTDEDISSTSEDSDSSTTEDSDSSTTEDSESSTTEDSIVPSTPGEEIPLPEDKNRIIPYDGDTYPCNKSPQVREIHSVSSPLID